MFTNSSNKSFLQSKKVLMVITAFATGVGWELMEYIPLIFGEAQGDATILQIAAIVLAAIYETWQGRVDVATAKNADQIIFKTVQKAKDFLTDFANRIEDKNNIPVLESPTTIQVK